MLVLREFKKLLPFTHEGTGLTLKLIDLKHRKIYVDNMLTDEYCKYNEIDFKSIGKQKLLQGYTNLVGIYSIQKYAESIRMLVMLGDKCIGGAAIYSKQSGEITLGYFVLKNYMGFGYGTKVLCTLKDYVNRLIEKGVINSKVLLEINKNNIKSIRVAEANEFKLIQNNNGILKYKM